MGGAGEQGCSGMVSGPHRSAERHEVKTTFGKLVQMLTARPSSGLSHFRTLPTLSTYEVFQVHTVSQSDTRKTGSGMCMKVTRLAFTVRPPQHVAHRPTVLSRTSAGARPHLWAKGPTPTPGSPWQS